MKTLKAFLCEADIDWVGSGWEPSSTYQVIHNHYYDKITPENVRARLFDLVNNCKWDKRTHEWIKKSSMVNKESEIDAYIDNLFKTNHNYRDYKFADFNQYIEDAFNSASKYDKSLNFNDWLNSNSFRTDTTWREYYEEEWEIISKRKSRAIESLHNSMLNRIKNTFDVTEQMIRNIKLDSKCVFGAIAFHSGDMKKYSEGYLKISDKSNKNKLVLEYTDNEAEALKLNTVGDMIDLLTSYKETKLLTESAGIGSKFANSINIRFDNNFKEGKLAVLKFKG